MLTNLPIPYDLMTSRKFVCSSILHGLRQHRHDPRLQVPQQVGVDVDGGRGVLLIDTNLLAPGNFF